MVDIIVEMNFGEDIVAGTFAYAVLISDRKLKFKSDGTKMNVLISHGYVVIERGCSISKGN